MIRNVHAAAIGLSVILAVCASSGARADGTPDTASNSAAAPSQAQGAAPESRVGPTPQDKGQIVFFRPWKYAGAAVGFSIHEGDKGVVKLGNNSYETVLIDPGTHVFTTESEAKDSLTLEIDAGETYYVEQTLGMGVILYRPHLTLSDQATFDGMKGLKLSSRKPSDLKEGSSGASGTQ
jgi:hypothetical protein